MNLNGLNACSIPLSSCESSSVVGNCLLNNIQTRIRTRNELRTIRLIHQRDLLVPPQHQPKTLIHEPGDMRSSNKPDVGPAQQSAIMSECSVDEVCSKLIEIFNDPRLYVHARRVHDTSVNAIYEQAEKNRSKKRKRKREVVSELEDTPDLTALKKGLADIKLKSWPLPPEAAVFMRGPKNSDINTLAEIKYSSNGSNPAPQSTIVVVSIYNRLAWSYNVAHNMSCYLPKLLKIYDAIPCPTNETPDERMMDGTFVGGQPSPPKPTMPVHRGNCEHFLVVDQIQHVFCLALVIHTFQTSRYLSSSSLLHPHNPPSGYPLTTQIIPPPPPLGNCRARTKVPAVYSVAGDIRLVRLGESPCLPCTPPRLRRKRRHGYSPPKA
ncbi:hypothetical protein EDB92DRAFT_1814852 [Lactarius akahatsu]|uniref:Uncharacterized protein n=1 Tax=Lactarius akahatsu TaxID=416441 RepID=A0AAD4LN13_9AGAM|nr:hypothetical protein EDB92DRAFT_1814852 [Lactarius akahatsu]